MRVLCLATWFPLPVDMGGAVRMLGLMQSLAREAEIHVLSRERASTTPALVGELSALLGAPVETFPAPPPAPDPVAQRARRWAAALAGGVPPYVLRNHSAALARRARELAPGFDVAVTHDDHAHLYAKDLHDLLPVVVDRQNVLGWSLRRRGPRHPGARARVAHELSLRLERRYEGADPRYATVSVTSPEEAERFERLYGHRPRGSVPSAVDLLPPRRTRAGARGVAWLGDHNYHANVEGLLRFAREGWAPLGEAGYELLVIGRDAPQEVRDLERLPGVRILGFVPDLGDVLDDALAAVVPLWHGAGVKMKTLTLMSAGLPVVATGVALEGIEAVPGTDCLRADDPAGLAAALREVLADPGRGARIGEAGRALVERTYTWEAMGPRLVELVRGVAAGR